MPLLREDRIVGRPAPPPPVAPLSRLLAWLAPEREDLWVVLLYAVGVGVLGLATPVAVQALVTTVAFGTLLQPLIVLGSLLLAGLGFGAVLHGLQTWVVETLRRRFVLRVVSDLAWRLPRVQASALVAGRGPELLNRFFDTFAAEKALASLLLDGLAAALTTAAGLLVLAFYHPWLLAFDALLAVGVLGVTLGLGRGGTATAKSESAAKYALAAWLEVLARDPTAWKVEGGARLAADETDRRARAWLAARAGHFRVLFRQIAGALALQAVASATLLGVGGWLVIGRQLTLGQLVASELIVVTTVGALAKAGKVIEAWYDLLASVDKVGVITDLPVEPEPEHGVIDGDRDAPALALGPVGALRRLERGARAALRIQDGPARARLAQALVGAEEPPPGWALRVAGIDLRDWRRDALRAAVARVHHHALVDGTIAQNVAFGRPLSRDRIWALLDRVGLREAIEGLPAGLDTELSAEGAPLASEDGVRLVAARALASDPALIVLDGVLDPLPPEARERLLRCLCNDSTAVLCLTRSDAVAHTFPDRLDLELLSWS